MDSDASWTLFVERLRAGEDQAVRELIARFANRLTTLAARHLAPRMRQKVDPEDVLQSVYRTLFRRMRQGEFELDSWGSLWGLLTVMTVRKCLNRNEHFQAACRNISLEKDIGSARWLPEVSPSADDIDSLMRTLDDALYGLESAERDAVFLHLQGFSNAEIGTHIGRAQRTVRRILARVRQRLENADRAACDLEEVGLA